MKTLKAVDINEDVVLSQGIVYFRLDDNLFEFLKLCEEKHGILGFEWDGSRNFGLILRKP